MSSTFLIVCAAMIVAALALVLVPLLRNLPGEGTGKDKTPAPRAVPAAIGLMVILPLAASAFYGATSNFPWDNPGLLGERGHAEQAGSMDEVTTQLEARLQQNPADLEGWRMLGRTYLMTGRVGDAVAAYEKASAITGGRDPDVELDLAEALVLSDRPEVQGRAQGILAAALAADENNQKALWYSGLMAARANDTETAKTHWTRLLDSNPPEEIRQILVNQLQGLGVAVADAAPTAPATGGMGGAASQTAPDAAAATGRTLRVVVSVDPTVAAKVRPGTTLFVSAREAGIPGPPLAAVRLSTDDLPTTVVLSDANAMVEGRNLSSVNEVQVVARVAFGGTAVPASGDLIGETRHQKGAPADLSVVINQVAP